MGKRHLLALAIFVTLLAGAVASAAVPREEAIEAMSARLTALFRLRDETPPAEVAKMRAELDAHLRTLAQELCRLKLSPIRMRPCARGWIGFRSGFGNATWTTTASSWKARYGPSI